MSAAGAGRLLSLEGRTALVAGASGGIGSAASRLLAEAGARVVGVDRPGVPESPAGRHVSCDLTDAGGVRRLLDDIRSREARLDTLVHCAGIRRDAVLWKMDDAAWSEVMRVNLDSAFHLLREAAGLMRDTGDGSIVLVSSINGERGKFGQANYAASKAALIGLARTAARELGRFGIRVNVVAPGLIATPMTATLPENVLRQSIEESVLGRTGEPDDVAAAILFLCAPMSRHITGQVLRVDGGQLIA